VGEWASAKPDSDEYRAFAARMAREKGPRFVRRMRALRDGQFDNPEARIPPKAAVALTELYMSEYSHAAPLDPGALLKFWERCGANSTGISLCRPGLETAKRLMIGDAPPAADEWLNAEPELTEQHAAPAPKPVDDDDAEL
jgi:hypothetical protein